jgi:hypothetical protein
MKKFTPLAKGLFTGIVMMLFSLAIYYFKLNRYTGIENLIYVIYAAGIIWALIEHSKMAQFTWKFKELFIQGFRCFIVVTLIMVIFTGIFSATHPEMAADNAIRYREFLIKEKNKTPAEIDEAVATGKKQFTTQLVSRSIFGSLIIGSIFTLAGAGFIMLRRNNPWT